MFERKGVFRVPVDGIDRDTVEMAALEGGADDLEEDEGEWVVTAPFDAYDACKQSLGELCEDVKGEITKVPENVVSLGESEARSLLKLLEKLEDLDDVQETHTNADIDDDVLSELG